MAGYLRTHSQISSAGVLHFFKALCNELLSHMRQGKAFRSLINGIKQCFSTAGPWPGTGHWHQLYRAARSKYFIVEIF
jgi:hypothetical protein